MLTILFFALIIKAIMIPIAIKQQKGTITRVKLAPKEKLIRDKYHGKKDQDSMAKMNQEIMSMYKEGKYNPLGGMLPIFFQLPVFFIIYHIISNPLKYISGLDNSAITLLGEKITKLYSDGYLHSGIPEKVIRILEKAGTTGTAKLSQIDIISCVNSEPELFTYLLKSVHIPDFTVLGFMDLSQTPSIANPSILIIIPILAFLFAIIHQLISTKLMPVQQPDSNKFLKNMIFIGPIMSLCIPFSVPGAIGVYWIFQSIIGIVQLLIISKFYPLPVSEHNLILKPVSNEKPA